MTPEQEEDLGLFREKVTDLRRRSILQGPPTLVVQVDPKVPTGLIGVNEDELRALLALLRQFNQKGPTSLKKVSRLVKAECGRPELCQWVDYAWKEWVKTLETRPFGLETKLREAMDLLLNTQVVHADRLKSRLLRPDDALAQGFLRQSIIVSLDRLCHGPVLLDRVIWHWLDAPAEPVPLVPDS